MSKKSIAIAMLAGLWLSSGFAAQPLKPIPGYVTVSQTEQIMAGQSKDEVIQMLGKPVSQPNWRNGTSSLVYKTRDTSSTANLYYVDFDTATGKVISSAIRPDEGSGMGSD